MSNQAAALWEELPKNQVAEAVSRFLVDIRSLTDYLAHARLGQALSSLLETYGAMDIRREQGGIFRITAGAAGPGDPRWPASAADLQQALWEALGSGVAGAGKRCYRCRVVKPRSHFGKLGGEAGANFYCRVCEAARLRAWRTARKGRAAARPAVAG
jgi:hypothetical protein